ncbi:hypothetical protein [Salinarimonas sp.]|uniref:hypothetical protein n=1 Tax=Salinarimonas sp. TaxID=2766526 RepID=UPI00391B146A
MTVWGEILALIAAAVRDFFLRRGEQDQRRADAQDLGAARAEIATRKTIKETRDAVEAARNRDRIDDADLALRMRERARLAEARRLGGGG